MQILELPGVRNVNPFQYSCLGNPNDRGAWQATVHGVAEPDMTEDTHTHTSELGMHMMVRDREAGRAAVHGIAKSLTKLSN